MSKIAGKYSINEYNQLIKENGLYSSKMEVDALTLLKNIYYNNAEAANI
jgi:hypothetical protein